MSTIYKREMLEFFVTPIAYVYLAATGIISAIYFLIMMLKGYAEFGSEFSLLFTVTLLLSPILTMRLFSEERRQNTIQLLVSSPVKLSDIVLGKFFAASTVYVLSLIPVLLQALSLAGKASINWSIMLGNFVGLVLVGMACIAICLLVSATTDNQIVSAVGGFGAMVFILLLNTLAGSVNVAFIRTILYRLSFFNSYYSLTVGVLSLSDIWFFITVTALFLFFAVQLLYKQRIRGR